MKYGDEEILYLELCTLHILVCALIVLLTNVMRTEYMLFKHRERIKIIC